MTVTMADRAATDDDDRLSILRARLASPMPDDRLWSWVWCLLVTAFGAFLRFDRLAVPRALIFDETYYVKDAWSILQHGVEWNTVSNANTLIQAGHTNIFQACSGTNCGEYVVQPEMGKLLIAVGEWMFGLNSFGWRFSSALFGSLAILLVCRIARRMTRSTLLGCIAGLLMSLDGLEFVLSRTGILDIFLMFFVLAAFGCVLIDRDESRERLAYALASGPSDEAGPQLGIRKWRVLAGVFIGLAIATKWDALWYLIAFACLMTAWDIGARRAAGLRDFVRGALIRDVVWLPVTFLVIPFVVYVASWSNWLITGTGYFRNYGQQHGVTTPVISALYSLYQYHYQAIKFGLGLHTPHPYQSQPWDWLVMTRPVAFFYECYTGPAGGPSNYCPSHYNGPEWSQEVLALGSPAIWWGSILALIFCLGWWLLHRDWRAGAVLCGMVAGWLIWFPLVSRTKFFYYALEFEPFLILALTLCIGLIIGPVTATIMRRSIGAGVVGAYLLAVLLMFYYFYPIWAGKVIPYQDWYHHMWYKIGKGWILRVLNASSRSRPDWLPWPDPHHLIHFTA
jgi:dolichyl-phosphate-mannose-protein mannosyltransferase